MVRPRGFTLLELMITVIVITILATIALSSYGKQVRKNRRSDALNSVASLQMRQDRWRAGHATYGAITDLGPTSLGTSLGGYYQLTVETPPSGITCATVGGVTPTNSSFNSYKIEAQAVGSQAKDAGCSKITLINLCGLVTKSSTGGEVCWPD